MPVLALPFYMPPLIISYRQPCLCSSCSRLHYNYFFPLSLADHRVCPLLIAPPTPLSLLSSLASGVASNYLTGTVPALSSGLRTLDVRYNFLTNVPAVTYTYCGGNNNCLLTPSKCATAGSTQRPTADCAICGTTNAVGPFCTASGEVCMPDAAANDAAGTVNAPVLPLLFMGNLESAKLVRKSFPSDISKLTTLTGLSMKWLRCNYLTGTLPASITNFKYLDIGLNFFAGVMPSPSWKLCSAYYNCFSNLGNCAWQARVAGQCSICGSTDCTGTLCGPGKACLPQDASALIAAGTLNVGQTNPACMDVPMTIHPVDAAALLNIKSTLGVTYTTWTATSPCRLFGSLHNNSSALLHSVSHVGWGGPNPFLASVLWTAWASRGQSMLRCPRSRLSPECESPLLHSYAAVLAFTWLSYHHVAAFDDAFPILACFCGHVEPCCIDTCGEGSSAIASLTSFSSPHLRPLHAPSSFCSPPLPSARPPLPSARPLCPLLAPLFLLLAPFALCSPLPRRSLTSNFFNYRIDSFTSSMKALPNLVDM
ncbi:unnamed protein product [Closterium sp. NIES-65]|nr:unnamed protein product [Closterium sp. NIES-65]